MWTCFLLVTLSIVCGLADAGYCTSTYNCTQQCSYPARYYTSCGLFYWVRCTKYRAAFRSCTRTCYSIDCCQGYTGSECESPTCFGTTSCPNGGRCVSPDKCECTTGFSPPHCTDVNECALENGGCSTNCENTMGSYFCTCKFGFSLDVDGISCIANYSLYLVIFVCCGVVTLCVIVICVVCCKKGKKAK